MIAAGPRREEGGRARPAAPAVGEVVARARLARRHRLLRARRPRSRYLDELGFNTVGYGCTTCIGNSGPLPDRGLGRDRRRRPRRVRGALGQPQLRGAHPSRGEGELPRLAAARRRLRARGRMDVDLETEPLGQGSDGARRVPARRLADARPRSRRRSRRRCTARCSRSTYADVFTGDEAWRSLPVPDGDLYAWDPDSTYVRRPPLPRGPAARAGRRSPTSTARAAWSCSATRSRPTTSRRPARSRPTRRPGSYLVEHGVEPRGLQLVRRAARQPRGDGARHVRQRPAAQPDRAGLGGHGDGARPLGRADDDLRRVAALPRRGHAAVVLAGKEYGTGSSRDWAAKGPLLLGVRAVIAESYERIHRSNLLMMGILPLQFMPGERPRVARPDRPRGVRDPRHRERRGARGDGDAPTAASSTRSSASTRRASASSSATAGSSRSSCGGSPASCRSPRRRGSVSTDPFASWCRRRAGSTVVVARAACSPRPNAAPASTVSRAWDTERNDLD